MLLNVGVLMNYLVPDITAISICEINCLALDTVHKLSSEEKKSRRSWDLSPGLLGGKEECFLCAMQEKKKGEKLRGFKPESLVANYTFL